MRKGRTGETPSRTICRNATADDLIQDKPRPFNRLSHMKGLARAAAGGSRTIATETTCDGRRQMTKTGAKPPPGVLKLVVWPW